MTIEIENGGGGGGSSSGSRRHSSGSGSNNDNDNNSVGEVLGESTSVLPTGAPDTGAGGTTPSPIASIVSLVGMLMSLVALRVAKIG